MIKAFFITMFFLVSFSISGQIADNTNKRDQSNIYNESIIQYFYYLNKEKFNISDTIYFSEDEFGLTDSLMERINGIRLIIIEQSEIEKLVIKKKGITMYKLFPLEYENQEFHVSLVPFGVTYKVESGLFFSNPGGYWINFKFNKGKFEFIRIDDNGI
jgi:hypothetical protein